MRDLIGQLTQEHRVILNRLESMIHSAHSTDHWQALISFCENSVENNHHKKEELILFNAIKDNPELRSGGPLCTLYFTQHIHSPSLKLATQLCKKLQCLNDQPLWSPLMQEVLDKNLPLIVPGGDHEAGRMLVRLAKTKSNPQELKEIFNLYYEIQTRHFDREENCFFRMCQSLLSSTQWQILSQRIQTEFVDLTGSQ